ncbi:CRE-CEP-1 protein [Caenorhabditis remanei]|uniref:CRE-CEP-1 protein n=1 Tax=Caenorhabditis remanei TaxID=31234 RepID=E3LYA3_CAERE|nr:CRE-CEP-1 protein [Caenorhabditis remanei]
MLDSQNSEQNKTQDMSQATIQRLINEVEVDVSVSPVMSQNTEDLLREKREGDPEFNDVYTEYMSKPPENDSFGNCFPSAIEPKQTKRRTPRIQDDLPSPDLNCSFAIAYPKSELLDTSIVSNTTISQIQTGSQNIEYLRERTPEEQALRNEKKIAEEFVKEEEMNARLEEEARNRMAENMTQRVIPMDDVDDEENLETVQTYGMEMDVMTERSSKVSNLAYLVTNAGEKHLWSKMQCNVPIELRWNIPSCLAQKKLWLKIRLVNYDNSTDLQIAIRNPKADVAKCRKHIEEETRIPPGAFFYIANSGHHWQPHLNGSNGGYTLSTIINPGTFSIAFDLIFMCQKMCMGIEDKRKSACLAAFLEDELKNEIHHAVIDQVYVVGYPRRDCNNFREKLPGFTFTESPSISKSIIKRPHFLPSTSLHQASPKSPQDMLNLNNNYQMFPSTSNSRKRGASENVFSRLHVQQTSTKPNSYAMRLHGCEPRNEQMEMDVIDVTPTAKRSRLIFHQHQDLRLYGKEYEKVIEFLAKEAEEAANKQPPHRYPINSIQPSDEIEKFIASVGLGNDRDRFRQAGIHTMSDLTKCFEERSEIFEWIGIDCAKLEKYYDVFLNYYRIQKRNKMRASSTRHQT